MSSVVQAVGFETAKFATAQAQNSRGMVCKRALDVSVVLIAIVVLLPLLLLIAGAIKLDGGPALFRHQRIGAGGQRFMCLKFRSMCLNSEKALADLFAGDPAAAREWRQTQKLQHDPRVTAIGRILRSTSLDELPQLFNVLLNDMSLVGPRPITAAEAARYGGMMQYYCAAKPGITGLWQVSGRSSTSYERRVELDVEYVRNWAFRKDLAIIARTVPAVLFRHGAC